MCENRLDNQGFHTPCSARLFLVGAWRFIALLIRRLGGLSVDGGRLLLDMIQAWEGKIRDFVHLVVPRKVVVGGKFTPKARMAPVKPGAGYSSLDDRLSFSC